METQKLQTLEEVFENRIFRIPDYQRGYSWSKDNKSKQLNDLWNDLMNMDDTYHFTGILTVDGISESSKFRWKEFSLTSELKVRVGDEDLTPFFIVDGQQRLVSIIILLFLLSKDADIVGKNKEIIETFIKRDNELGQIYLFGYEKDTPSHEYLIGKILEDPSQTVVEPNTIYTKNLDGAKSFFHEKIKALDSFNKRRLHKHITKYLLFNVLELSSKKLDISLIFETLNYRGKPLSKLELFKNRLIFLVTKKYSNDENKKNSFRKEIVRTWLEVYKWLGANSNKSLEDDDFLRAFWIMFFEHSQKTDKDFKLYEQDIFDEKYKIADVEKNNFLIEHGEFNLNALLETLALASKYWFFIHNPRSDEVDLGQQVRCSKDENIKMLLEKLLNNRYGDFMRPLILAFLIKYDTDPVSHKNINNLLIEVERHNYCVFLFAGRQADTNRAEIYRETNFYFFNDTPKWACDKIRELTDKWITWENVYEHIHSNRAKNEKFYDWNGITYTLLEWDEYLQSLKDPVLEWSKEKKVEKYKIFDEHMLRRRDGLYEGVIRNRGSQSIAKLMLSLGNVSIYRTKRNERGFGNLSEFHREGSYSDRDIAENYPVWDDVSILDRGLRILEFIENKWNINYKGLRQDEIEKKRIQLLVDGVKIGTPVEEE